MEDRRCDSGLAPSDAAGAGGTALPQSAAAGASPSEDAAALQPGSLSRSAVPQPGGLPQSAASDEAARALERVIAAHEAYFDIERDFTFAGRTFPAFGRFHSTASRYVLVKRAKLWEASAHEYLFFCTTPRLDAATLRELVGFATSEALDLVELSPDHMTSYLSLAVIADVVDEEVHAQIKRTRFRKNFSLGLRGWADLRVAAVDLARGRVSANSQGKPLGETLQANAFIADGGGDGHRLDASSPAFSHR